MKTGRRAWDCEVSTIDSAFLLAGALTAGAYFDAEPRRNEKFAISPMRSTAGAIGLGRRTAKPR